MRRWFLKRSLGSCYGRLLGHIRGVVLASRRGAAEDDPMAELSSSPKSNPGLPGKVCLVTASD
eukprot:1844096-Alexandrium_andersonii.AAC.1